MKSAEMSIAGMVTLYNSEETAVRRIGSYVNQIDKLYVVDNSDLKNEELIACILEQHPKAVYISNQGNKGIAYALNVAAITAIQDGYEYLLMMDDDSETDENFVFNLYSAVDESSWATTGIVASKSDEKGEGTGTVEVLTAITSGSILNLSAYQKIGPFIDSLFIDWVDHEYCFRLRLNGYRILMANQIKLNHRLGMLYHRKIFGLIHVKWRSHSPTRLYYKFRNSIYVMNQYAKHLPLSFLVPVYFELLRDIAKIIFVEPDKRTYLYLVKRGIEDAYARKLGKLSYKLKG